MSPFLSSKDNTTTSFIYLIKFLNKYKLLLNSLHTLFWIAAVFIFIRQVCSIVFYFYHTLHL